jgi:hypothetical protein
VLGRGPGAGAGPDCAGAAEVLGASKTAGAGPEGPVWRGVFWPGRGPGAGPPGRGPGLVAAGPLDEDEGAGAGAELAACPGMGTGEPPEREFCPPGPPGFGVLRGPGRGPGFGAMGLLPCAEDDCTAVEPPFEEALLPSKESFNLRTTGASTVEEAERTNSPRSWSLAMMTLLSTPISLASS